MATETKRPQYLTALDRANEVRLERAARKRDLVTAEDAAALIEQNPAPWWAASMTLADVILTLHRWGRGRMLRLLAAVPVSETKTLGALTPRQRSALVGLLRGS